MPRPLGWTPTTPVDDVNLNANTKDVIGDLDQLNPIYFPNNNLVSAINAVPSVMEKTFFVDAVNGNDANDGSQANPFKTIKKAINSVPVGGAGLIYLSNTQTHIIDTDIIFHNKMIQIISWSSTSNPGFPDDNSPVIKFADDGTNVSGRILYSGILTFGDYSHTLKIEVGDGLTALNGTALATTGIVSESGNGVDVLNTALVVAHTSISTSATFISGIPLVYLRYGLITVQQGGIFMNITGRGVNFFQSGGYIQDSSGNDISTTSISGIVKDANGVPRNIVSNIIF